MKKPTGEFWKRLGRKVRAHFLAGILIMVPIGLTVWIFVQIFTWVDSFLQPGVISPIFGRQVPGLGFAITAVLIYIVGVIASNVVGRRVIRWAESLLERVPVARHIYTGIRQIVESFSTPGKTGFMQVVLIEFPRRGTRTIGFITNEESNESGKKLINVFVPTSPNPTSGFLQIVEEQEIIRTSISVDDALKMVVSGGRMSPEEVKQKLLAASQEANALESGPGAVDLVHGKKEAPAGKNVQKQKTPRRPSSPKTG